MSAQNPDLCGHLQAFPSGRHCTFGSHVSVPFPHLPSTSTHFIVNSFSYAIPYLVAGAEKAWV